MTLHLNK